MTFSLCYTSIRAEFIPAVVDAWFKRAKHPEEVEVVLSVDAWDTATIKAAQQLEAEMPRVRTFLQVDKPGTCVKGWNQAASESKGDILIAIADDFVPPPEWDEALIGVAEDGWWQKDHVVKVWDGYNPDLCTLSIMTRARYEKLGYLFYPGYLSMFNDTEFTATARIEPGVMIDAMHLLFEHHHPDCGKRQRDAHDLEHASSLRWQLGEYLFHYRRDHRFPIDMGPVAERSRIKPVFNPDYDKFAVYIQAVKDDFCLWEVCYRMAESGVKNFYFFVPSHYWHGDIVPDSDKSEVYEIAGRLIDTGANVKTIDLDVHFDSGNNRLEVETDFRNRSLQTMWDDGIEHALIVDGDELWERGFLQVILPYIADSKAIQCPMVPVIGLPGFPVDQAYDNAVIYIHKDNKFASCRTPVIPATTVAIRGVIHFTATRKTREQIIEKMRGGGHYDDPDYDFEGWIQRKLPNIRPGMVNAHMYRPYQIWPLVRAWTKEEIEHVPPSIRPYLGLPHSQEENLHGNKKKIPLSEMAKLLHRPPCQEKSTFRVGVFVGGRR